MKILILLVLSVLFIPSVSAGSYVGISQTEIDYENSEVADLDFEARGVIIGYEIGNNAAVEFRYSEGSDDDTLYGYDVKIDSTYGVYGKYKFASSAPITPYVLLGFTKAKLKVESFGSDSESDLSYGAGFSVSVTESISIAAEYMVLIKKKGAELNQTAINLVYEF